MGTGFAIWRSIPLTQGKVAWVDQAEYAGLARFSWHVIRGSRYASRTTSSESSRHGRGQEYMHRSILRPPRGFEVDHINGDGLDNRRINLRVCTRADNQHNQRPRAGTSCYKGVSWSARARKWAAQIVVGGCLYHLGWFADETAAALAYDMAAIDRFGEFSRPNFLRR